MPNSVVKSFAKKTGKSIDEVEKLWDKAVELALKKGLEKDSEQFFAYTTGILKRMMKVESKLTPKVGDYIDIQNDSKIDNGPWTAEIIEISGNKYKTSYNDTWYTIKKFDHSFTRDDGKTFHVVERKKLTLDPELVVELYTDGTPHRMRAEPIGSASTIFKRDKYLRRRGETDKKKVVSGKTKKKPKD